MRNKNGFSFIEVMMAAAMVGGIALVITQLMKNAQSGNTSLESNLDVLEIKRSMILLLTDKRYCRVSLAHEFTKDTFYRQDANDLGSANEGLEVELFYSDIEGTKRSKKMFNGRFTSLTDPDLSTYGKAMIKSIKFYLDNGKSNYSNSPKVESEIGTLEAYVEKRVSSKTKRDVVIQIPVSVSIVTGPDHGLPHRKTKIVGCN